MRPLDELFAALRRSSFRRGIRLRAKDRAYLREKTLPVVVDHARKFVTERLAPARPVRDGKQTPMRGHPAFVAQHATATCCRRCLARWHHIPQGRPLKPAEIDHVLAAIERWLAEQAVVDPQLRLFAGDTPDSSK